MNTARELVFLQLIYIYSNWLFQDSISCPRPFFGKNPENLLYLFLGVQLKHQKIRASSFKEIPKAILPSEPKVVQEEVDQEPISPSTPSVVEVSADIPTSPEPESHEEKGPSSSNKLNHPC